MQRQKQKQQVQQPQPQPPPPSSSVSSGSLLLSYAHHATITYREVKSAGSAVRPLDFPPPKVRPGVRVNALVVHPQTGSRQVCAGVIHREDLSSLHRTYHHHHRRRQLQQQQQQQQQSTLPTLSSPTLSTSSSPNHRPESSSSSSSNNNSEPHLRAPVVTVSPASPHPSSSSSSLPQLNHTALNNNNHNNTDDPQEQQQQQQQQNETNGPHDNNNDDDEEDEVLAYWPQRRLQDAIYGSVWACLILRRHYGVAADDAARAAHVEPGSPEAPLVWEITGQHVAIKMVEWSRVHHMRGRLLEDPVKEVAALQMLDVHPNVLHSTEVLQDSDFLYSVMPYCRDGDLFGIVVKYAEDSGGEIGMPEPVARYWFRQILNGLHHLQHKGVCHRDLSLENVLVDHDKCYIMDMGMCLRVPYTDPTDDSKIVDVAKGSMRRLIKPQGVCGKHNYMSPEIAANTEAFDGFAIDLWAAGVILYIMLTGFPPYDHANRTDQRFELIITGRLMEQLRNWDILLSEEAGDLMQKMLQYHPKNRLTLAQVMDHPWVTNEHVEIPPPEEPNILSF